MSDEPSLLDEFRATRFKGTKCVVCFEVSPEVRGVVEDGLKRGIGSVAISGFLRKRGLWHWSNAPIETHKEHV